MASFSRDDVSQKLNALVKAVTDLSGHVEATEEHQKEGGASPSNSSSNSHPRRRARHQETPDQTLEVAEEVHWRVAKRLKELPAYHKATSEEDYTSEEEEEEQQVHRRKWKGLKSDMHLIGVTCPDDLVDTLDGKPAA